MKTRVCSSCNKAVFENAVEFKCPECGKETLVRCDSCRAQSKPYKCKCGFEGP